MPVYVDKLDRYPSGTWAHMMADTEEELHEMADRIGLKREWYQGDHYDIKESKRRLAVRAEAVEVTNRQLASFRMARRRSK